MEAGECEEKEHGYRRDLSVLSVVTVLFRRKRLYGVTSAVSCPW